MRFIVVKLSHRISIIIRLLVLSSTKILIFLIQNLYMTNNCHIQILDKKIFVDDSIFSVYGRVDWFIFHRDFSNSMMNLNMKKVIKNDLVFQKKFFYK